MIFRRAEPMVGLIFFIFELSGDTDVWVLVL
jgi:hypothetical protein